MESMFSWHCCFQSEYYQQATVASRSGGADWKHSWCKAPTRCSRRSDTWSGGRPSRAASCAQVELCFRHVAELPGRHEYYSSATRVRIISSRQRFDQQFSRFSEDSGLGAAWAVYVELASASLQAAVRDTGRSARERICIMQLGISAAAGSTTLGSLHHCVDDCSRNNCSHDADRRSCLR